MTQTFLLIYSATCNCCTVWLPQCEMLLSSLQSRVKEGKLQLKKFEKLYCSNLNDRINTMNLLRIQFNCAFAMFTLLSVKCCTQACSVTRMASNPKFHWRCFVPVLYKKMVLVSVLCSWFTAIKFYPIKNGLALLFRMREVLGSNFGIQDVLVHKIYVLYIQLKFSPWRWYTEVRNVLEL